MQEYLLCVHSVYGPCTDEIMVNFCQELPHMNVPLTLFFWCAVSVVGYWLGNRETLPLLPARLPKVYGWGLYISGRQCSTSTSVDIIYDVALHTHVLRYDSSTRESSFSVGLQGIREEDVPRVKEIIWSTLERVAR